MKQGLLLAVLFGAVCVQPLPAVFVMNAAQEAFTSEEGYKAAYFGDTAKLSAWIDGAGGFEKMHWGNGSHEIVNTLCFAIQGNRSEVVRLFIKKGFPKETWDAGELFHLRQMDVSTARLFVENVPNFIERFGVYALSEANRTANPEVVHYLLEQGVDPNGVDRRDPKSLIALPILQEAIASRNKTIVDDLLNHGADPYAYGVMDALLLSRSADLIRFVDRKHRYEKQATVFAKEYAPPAGSPFPGIWAYQKEGFGSSAFMLNPDGTAVMFTDVGGSGLIWRGVDHRLDLFPIPPGPQPLGKDPIMSFQLSEDGKTLHGVPGGREQPAPTWTRVEETPTPIEISIAPTYIRIETMRLSPDRKSMQLQINGRHIETDTARFLQAGESRYPEKPSPENMIDWFAFQPGPLGKAPSGWLTIPYLDRHVAAAYRNTEGELGYDHETKADTIDGNDFTLFPCGSESWQDGLYAQSFVLLSHPPLPNGKHLLYFYIAPHRVTRDAGSRL